MQSTSTKSQRECDHKSQSNFCQSCIAKIPSSWGQTHVYGIAIAPNTDCSLDDPVNIMFVGEAPGATEDEVGLPFVGKAGQLLQDTLRNIPIDQNFYVTNVIKHRPPNNRKPSLHEMVDYGLFLCSEIIEVRPKIIVCLGRSPAEYLMNLQGIEKSGSLRGYQFTLKSSEASSDNFSCQVICTWHPSYILRREDKLDELKEDILKAIAISKN